MTYTIQVVGYGEQYPQDVEEAKEALEDLLNLLEDEYGHTLTQATVNGEDVLATYRKA